jgi:hypothetical protein
LQHLRIHTHSPLTWDERYQSFIHRVGFLSLARLITTRGLPVMDSIALAAPVDWWRPEMHTLHLSCGETTVMRQDVTMILGLPTNGTPICGMVSSAGCRDSIIEARPNCHDPQLCTHLLLSIIHNVCYLCFAKNLKFNFQLWTFEDAKSQPLLGYRWSRITNLTCTIEGCYMMYMNAFDCITSR